MVTFQQPEAVFPKPVYDFQIFTKIAILNWFLLILDSKADVEEVGNNEEKVQTEDGSPANLC